MLKIVIDRPIGISMLILSLVLLGIVGLNRSPINLLPEIAIPRISVHLELERYSIEVLEELVVKKVRNQLSQINTLEDIQSRTWNGKAQIDLIFPYNTNTNLAFIEVNEKIDQIMGSLPKEMNRPTVVKSSVSDIPIVYLSVLPNREEDRIDFNSFCKQVVRRRLEQIPEIAAVEISGLKSTTINIIPNIKKIDALNISVQEIGQQISAQEFSINNTFIKNGQYQFNLNLPTGFSSVEDIGEILITKKDVGVLLREIATIEITSGQKGKYLYNNKEGAVFAITKKNNGQLFQLKDKIDILLTDLKNLYPSIDFVLSNDQSSLLEVSISNLSSSLIFGSIFAFVIVFVFSKDWMNTLLIGFSIPISIMITILGLYLCGISINIISLAGLILGLGLMIDNSIIILESIHAQRSASDTAEIASIQGAQEVIGPLISSALTTCSVFLPLIFLSGIAGSLFFDQAVSVGIALFVSLFISYYFIPIQVNYIAKHRKERKQKTARNSIQLESALRQILKHKVKFLIAVYLLVGIIFTLSKDISSERFPALTSDGITLKIDWRTSIGLGENETRIQPLLDSIRKQGNTDIQVFLGENQFLSDLDKNNTNQAQVNFFTKDLSFRSKIKEVITRYLEQGIDVKFNIRPIPHLLDRIFGDSEYPLQLNIQSKNSPLMPQIEDIQFLLDSLRSKGISYDIPGRHIEYSIQLIEEEIVRYGLQIKDVQNQLQILFAGSTLAYLNLNEEIIPVNIYANHSQELFTILNEAGIKNQSGRIIPISTFVKLNKALIADEIWSNKRGKNYPIRLKSPDKELYENIDTWIRDEGNLTANYEGRIMVDKQLLNEVKWIFLISVSLLYFILAAQFESLWQPLILLLILPISMAGSLCALYLTQGTINIISMIGMVVMSGIIVNDAILKVDMINKLRKEHSLLMAIELAGARRFRPIVMTSLTTILALSPILLSKGLGAELQQPLASTVIGGLLFGTLSSLYVLPCLITVFTKGEEIEP